MSNMTSESEGERTECINSASDEGSSERNMIGGNGSLKKGPWTSAEDAILVEYVKKNGQGNWNAVQKDSGLSRCGKSCRLRWANHLRPDLKKGAFTPEEERRIIELHAKMGNKWARMAIELPGRTDNEIKNFWNTRTKRRQRAGLPIYPPDVCLQTLNDNTQSQNMMDGDTSSHPPEILANNNNNFQIPAVEFKNLGLLSHELYAPSLLDIPGPDFLDIPGNTLVPQSLGNKTLLFPVSHSHPPKRIRRSDPYPPIIYDGGGGSLNDIFPAVNLYEDLHGGDSSSFSGSHAHVFFNGNSNTSSSDPLISSWVTKMELPSLQYSTTTPQTQMGGGGGSCGAPSSPLPSLESADTLMMMMMMNGHYEKSVDRNNGLLEAVLYESQTLKKSKRDNNNNTTTCSDEEEDPMSPLGHSAASVFSEYTPHITTDEHQSLEAISVKHEADESSGGKQSDEKPNHMNIKYCRPDLLLDNSWFGSTSTSNPDLIDPLAALLAHHDDDYMAGPATISGSPFDDSAKWDDEIS